MKIAKTNMRLLRRRLLAMTRLGDAAKLVQKFFHMKIMPLMKKVKLTYLSITTFQRLIFEKIFIAGYIFFF